MPYNPGNRVWFTANAAPGLGAIVVGAAVNGYQTPAQAGIADGDVCDLELSAADINGNPIAPFEVVKGSVYTASNTSFSRSAGLVEDGTAGAGTLNNFTTSPRVGITIVRSRLKALAAGQANTLMGYDASGNFIDITAGSGITIVGGSISGNVYSADETTLHLAGSTFSIHAKGVALAQIADGPVNSLLGYDAAGHATIVTAGANITISAGVISASGGGGSGTVTQVNTGTGLTGGPITTSGTISLVVPVVASSGGTGLTTITAHAVMLGAGTAAVALASPGVAGQALLSQGAAADPAFETISGDMTLSGLGVATLANSGVTAGTYAQVTVNAKGLVTAGTNADVSHGGTGATTFTAHGILLGEGTSSIVATTAMTNGQLLIGQAAADPAPTTVTGDWTITAGGVATLKNTGAAGTYGQVTTDAQGRVTAGATCDVAHGGTGDVSLTAYAVLCGGTTSTSAVQSVAGLGASGQVLTSNGAGALPSFQAVGTATASTLLYVDDSQPGGNTISNTVTVTAFASGYTIAGNSLVQHQIVEIDLEGVYSTDTADVTGRLQVKAGTTVIADTNTFTLPASQTNMSWGCRVKFIVPVTGVSGSILTQGRAYFCNGATTELGVGMPKNGTTGLDLTAAQALTFVWTWGTASANNTITLSTPDIRTMIAGGNLSTPLPLSRANGGTGVDTSAFAIDTILGISHTGAVIAYTAGTNVTISGGTISASGGGGGSVIPAQNDFVLSLQSATPYPTTDQSGSSLFCLPFNAFSGTDKGTISVFFGSAYSSLSAAQVTIALAGMTAGKNYDVFAYTLDGSTLKFDLGPAWATNTTRGTGAGTTELYSPDGAPVNKVSMTGLISGDTIPAKGGHCIGTIRATAATTTRTRFGTGATQTGGSWLVSNMDHRRKVSLTIFDTTATFTTSSTTWESADKAAANNVEYVNSRAREIVTAKAILITQPPGSGSTQGNVGVGVDSTSTNSAQLLMEANFTAVESANVLATADYDGQPGDGYHVLNWIQQNRGGGGVTFNGSPIGTQQSGMRAEIWA